MASFTRLFSPALASTPPHSTFPRSRSQWAKVLCIGLSLASMAFASPDDELPDPTSVAAIRLAAIDGEPRPTLAPEPTPTPETVDELVLDDRIAFWDGENWSRLLPAEHELRRRAQAAESVTTTLEIPVSTEPSTTASSSTRTRSTVTITASATTATTTASPLPVFFDGGLSANFTESSCPTFINNMISAPEFNECYPISLLLQGSTSFFEAEKSLVSISRVLDNACAANVTSCANYLANVATNLTQTENCGDDYDLGNPTVTAAYEGLIAYQVVYGATCLKDEESSVYCFGDAVTNTTNPSNTYFYFLPLNSSLPGATSPTCSGCLQDTMQIYHVATANRKQPIADTYEGAAQVVDVLCGTGFANVTLAEAITTSGAPATFGPPNGVLLFTLVVMMASWFI